MSALFDKYRFEKELGHGAFGKVFLAVDEIAKLKVAIKQLKSLAKDKQDDFIKETQVIANLNHANIVSYKHNFIKDDLLYLVMEYCSLGNLRSMFFKEKIKSSFSWKWISTLTETLQFIHEKGIVHHDIKPDNILFTEDRIIKISDFGIANTGGGTFSYMCPKSVMNEIDSDLDPRVDIYALGVTAIELLTGQNPFAGKSITEIIEIHEKKDFGIHFLPNWQQEILQKAIAIIPEQRFQSMREFNEAINAQNVPIIFDKEAIKAGDYAYRAKLLLDKKKWSTTHALLKYAEKQLKPNVNVLHLLGRYYLFQNNSTQAKIYFDKALKWNPRLDVQKELGWINLELKNYPTAISLLSDHIHRNPSDYEAYNLLLQCFYETERYEQGMSLAKLLLDIDKTNHCFQNNFYICAVMHKIGNKIYPDDILKAVKLSNVFLNYNFSVVVESVPSHSKLKEPTLKSKLIFMDYRFNNFKPNTLYCTNNLLSVEDKKKLSHAIISFGREGFNGNDIFVSGGTAISRRHCLIINCKDDIWLYDLESTGTYLNNELVKNKAPLIGKNLIRIGQSEYELTDDKGKLL